MIGDLAAAVREDLKGRRFPYRVVHGPTVAARDGFHFEIIFERDRDADEVIEGPAGAKHQNPQVPFNRYVAGHFTVYARSSKSGATVRDHEEECDHVVDGVVTAMVRILAARKLPLRMGKARVLSREALRDIRGDAPTDDRSGSRSADFPGCASRVWFSVGTCVRDVEYPGDARPEYVLEAVAPPTVNVIAGAPPAEEDP